MAFHQPIQKNIREALLETIYYKEAVACLGKKEIEQRLENFRGRDAV